MPKEETTIEMKNPMLAGLKTTLPAAAMAAALPGLLQTVIQPREPQTQQQVAPEVAALAGMAAVAMASDVMTGDKIQEYAIAIITVVVSTFFWVFSVVAVYAIFMRQYESTGKDYFRLVAYGASAFALLIPGSGYVIIFLAFAVPAFVTEYIADKVQ
jgi:hypothetical protein